MILRSILVAFLYFIFMAVSSFQDRGVAQEELVDVPEFQDLRSILGEELSEEEAGSPQIRKFQGISFNKAYVPILEDEKGEIPDSNPYFVGVFDKSEKLLFIGYYNAKKMLSTYLANRKHSIYFSYIKFQYVNSPVAAGQEAETPQIQSVQLYDNKGKEVAKYRYVWGTEGKEANQENAPQYLKAVLVSKYDLVSNRMVDIAKIGFHYGDKGPQMMGGKLSMEKSLQAKSTNPYGVYVYGEMDQPDHYVRYKQDGKTIAYVQYFLYDDNGNLARIDVYNSEGMLIHVEDKNPQQDSADMVFPLE